MDLKFSIITPSYNNGHFIVDTIESVLNQTYKNFEYIIIDGGSNDDTVNILKKYKTIKWISEKDGGSADAINKGLKLMTGDYYSWINSDDYYELDALYNVFEAVKKSRAGLIYGNLNYVDYEKKLLRNDKTHIYDLNYLLNYDADIIRQPATFFKSDLLLKTGNLKTELKCVFDYDFILQYLKVTQPYFIDKTLANYRDHNNTLTRRNISTQGKEIIKVSVKNGGKLTSKLLFKNLIRKVLLKNIYYGSD